MEKFLVYNFSGELDDMSHLFPNERLGRIGSIIRASGREVEIIDRANVSDLTSFGSDYMKNLGGLSFFDSNELYESGVQQEARRLVENGYHTTFLNLWHGSGFKFSADLARAIKKLSPKTAIYGVGQKVDWFREHIFRFTGDSLDGLIGGLGYDAILHLVNDGRPQDCPGMIMQVAGKPRINRRDTINADDYPLAIYQEDVYRNISGKVLVYTITLSNQACPNRCAFCVRTENYGRVNLRRNVDKVLSELRSLRFDRNVRHFRVEDSTPPAMAMTELARAVLESDLRDDVQFSGFARIDTNSVEDFDVMRKAGFKALFFGIESLDPESLVRIRKGITVKSIRETLRAAHEAGIATVGSFIFPLPGETHRSMTNTLKGIEEVRPWLDSLVVFPAGVYPPTEWGRHPEKYGIRLDDDYYERAVIYPLKYQLPFKYWPPMPFRYTVMDEDVETVRFSKIAEIYEKFLTHIRKELRIPAIPDYYFLLADMMRQDPLTATQRLVQLMIARDYAGLKEVLPA